LPGSQLRATSAAENAARTFVFCNLDVLENLLELRSRRDGPDLSVREQRVAHLRSLYERNQHLDEAIVDALLQQKP